MSDRRDYLPVCNDHGVPLPEFQAEFCVRCVQPECSRSKAGGLFDSRVATWRERLFVNPPRMSKDDPLYPVIAGKMFREIEVGRRIPEIGVGLGTSAWVDPLTIDEPKPEPRPAPRAAAPAPVTAPPSADGAIAPVAAVVDRTRPKTPVNTPFVQGTMIGAAAPPKPVVDPWGAGPAAESRPKAGDGKVVSPGAKIRFRAPPK